jgi:hypothetical protein
MPTRTVIIDSTPFSRRTLRSNMRNPPWGYDTTLSMGGDILRNGTWIRRYTRMIARQACTTLPGFRGSLLVANDRYRAAETPPSTVAANPRSELTLPCISRHINAIVGSVSQIRTPAEKSSRIGVGRQEALEITAMATPKIGSVARTTARTTARTVSGIGTRGLLATRGVAAGTLRQIVAAIPESGGRPQEARRGYAGQERRSRHKG